MKQHHFGYPTLLTKLQKSWTDDTDHALLTVLSYLHHDGKLLPNDLAARLRTWAEQGLRCLERLPLGLGRTVGKVSGRKQKTPLFTSILSYTNTI